MLKSSQPVSTRLKEGDCVVVFEDPYTRQRPEGRARLISLYKTQLQGGEYWNVRFIDSRNIAKPETYVRLISVDDTV